ncbi:MAG TPA: tetrathionate reductase family octaheme c-type cytochrome [Bacteroidaceae bacterium]|nr:tetrathionate reductase family octaheme c-type cytochrome [Bacteroidaceae bacterium]
MNKAIAITILLVILVLFFKVFFHTEEYYNLKLEKLKQEYAIKPVSSIEHAKLTELNRNFSTPQEVTEQCNSCHTERYKEIMKSSHWNWERVSYVEGRGISTAGKKNVLNNYCIGPRTNEQTCAKCHIGFGMTNDLYDFDNARNVDCMVCHDNSDEYLKGASMAGFPDRSVNLTNVAQNVGRPDRINCGSCHFFSGGGNNVKHGDLEAAQLSCDRETDVHMAANGINLTCVDCHTAENHRMLGKLYSVSSSNTMRSTCEQCHTNTPHFDNILNRHDAKVSCQACHIPVYAKENATKMEWNWSDAGRLRDGKPYSEADEDGNEIYLSIKGSFRWEKNVIPDYAWFNGTADQYLTGDTIREVPVKMNTLFGSHDDINSKIIPIKIHVGNQIYDKKYNRLIQPKLYSETIGDSAYWKEFDWHKAAEAGMRRVGLPYSGEHDFVQTITYWPVNHMVSPKNQSVGCAECHTRNNGRLANLAGFYLPGRDSNRALDIFGTLLFFAVLGAVIIHAAFRIIVSIRNKKYGVDQIDYHSENSHGGQTT